MLTSGIFSSIFPSPSPRITALVCCEVSPKTLPQGSIYILQLSAESSASLRIRMVAISIPLFERRVLCTALLRSHKAVFSRYPSVLLLVSGIPSGSPTSPSGFFPAPRGKFSTPGHILPEGCTAAQSGSICPACKRVKKRFHFEDSGKNIPARLPPTQYVYNIPN